jgi:ADP-ribose pyrophosphatase YjhB (NUDIX family)
MGFPGPTVDVPGAPQPALAAEVASAVFDPWGDAAALAGLLAGAAPAGVGPVPGPGHVTVTAWVLDASGRSVLLIHHRTLGWAPPGGHLDPGEAPADGAARELAEEAGVSWPVRVDRPVVVHGFTFPARGDEPEHRHWNLGYLIVGDPAAPLTPEREAEPVAWFAIDALPEGIAGDVPETLALIAPLLQT